MITQAGRSVASNPGTHFSANGTPQMILAPNPKRLAAWFTALSGNTKRLRYRLQGDTANAAPNQTAMGLAPPLEAGGTVDFDSSYLGAVWVTSDDGSAQDVYVVEW